MINKKLDQMTTVLNWFLGIILTLMLLITFIQVVLRYVFNSPLIWADEVTLVMLTWYGYIIIAILVKEGKHISLEFLYSRFNQMTKKGLDLLRNILILGFAILMVYFGSEMVINTQGRHLPASHLPRSLLYFPLIISGLLISFYTINHVITLLFPRTGREAGDRR
ncbi:2,3-diketo-L-gulonate TRAP transporter small permease protein YiaM [Halalkalibacter krulwichiae]|uniref:2,3-diketo-L-gulonate TRAP transporter small permease protein YiaM n=2 Tax=Halalkalibacter krulwichiae TaxID=199441 RepID=A0A1X9MG55_9BACI|nr:2,3-diketo-L-gulonate TRAP transporter small permease protein YiaM [Halalkalibacter krulwichiae]